MADRIRTSKDTSWGATERPWVVFVDGRHLVSKNGSRRRFKTEARAREAGVKATAGVSPSSSPSIPRSDATGEVE